MANIKKNDFFETEWNRSISIEEFRMQCKKKLKEIAISC